MEKKSNSQPRSGAGYMRRRHRPIWESRRSHNSNMPTGYVPVAPTQTGTRGRGRQPARPTMDQGGGEAVPFRQHPNITPHPPGLTQPSVVAPPALPSPPVLQHPRLLPRPPALHLPHSAVLPQHVLPSPSVVQRLPVLPYQYVLPQPNVLPHPPVLPHVGSIPPYAPVMPSPAIHRPVLPPIDTTYMCIGDNSRPNTGPSTRHNSPLSTSSEDFEVHVAYQLQKAFLSGVNTESARRFTESCLTEDLNTRADPDDPFPNDDVRVLTAKVKAQTDYLVCLRGQRHSNTQYIQQIEEYLQSIQQEASRCHQRRLVLGAEAKKVSEHLNALRKRRATNDVRFRLMVSNNKVLRKVCQRMEEEILNPKHHIPGAKDNVRSIAKQTQNIERKQYTNEKLINQICSEDKNGQKKTERQQVSPKKSTTSLGQDFSKQSLPINDVAKNTTISRSTKPPATNQNCCEAKNASSDVIHTDVCVQVPLVTHESPSLKKTALVTHESPSLKKTEHSSNAAAKETRFVNVSDRDCQLEGRLRAGVNSHNQSESHLQKAPDNHKAVCSSISGPEKNLSFGVISPVSMFKPSENSAVGKTSPSILSSKSHRKLI